MPTFVFHPLILAAALVLVGCGGGNAGARRAKIVDAHAARLTAPSKPLAEYATFRLTPAVFEEEVRKDERKVKVAEDLAQRVDDRLQPLFRAWGGGSGGGALDVQVVVTSLRIVSGGARTWLGAYAGDSHIDVDLVLTEPATGTVVARPKLHLEAGGMAGAWSYGSSDRNLVEYAADVVYEYLRRHHPKSPPTEPRAS